MHLKAKLKQKWKSESALRWCFWFYYPHLGKTSQEPLQRSKQILKATPCHQLFLVPGCYHKLLLLSPLPPINPPS